MFRSVFVLAYLRLLFAPITSCAPFFNAQTNITRSMDVVPTTPERKTVESTAIGSPPRFSKTQMDLAFDPPKSPAQKAANIDTLSKIKMPGAMKVRWRGGGT